MRVISYLPCSFRLCICGTESLVLTLALTNGSNHVYSLTIASLYTVLAIWIHLWLTVIIYDNEDLKYFCVVLQETNLELILAL